MTGHVLLAIPLLLGQPTTSLGEIDRAIAAVAVARERIADYHLVVKNVTTYGESDAKEIVSSVQYRIWSSGVRHRTDSVTTQTGGGRPDVKNRREVICRNCDRAGYATQFMQKDQARSDVMYAKLDAAFDSDDWSNLDWRYLGLLNGEALSLQRLRYDAALRGIQKLPTLTVG